MSSFRTISRLLICLFLLCSSAIAQIVEIPDPNLAAAIRDNLGLNPNEPIQQEDLLRLTSLEAIDRGIKDLTGLEYMTNLRGFNLYKNEIVDISPLASLTKLTWFNLLSNQIVDLTPLRKLVRLRTIILSNNRIKDVHPLGSLTNLVYLNLRHNQITDFTPLANLVNLERLRIEYNPSTDISFANGLNLIEFIYHEICDLPRLPIQERIDNRSFPSIFQAWNGLIDDSLTEDDRTALHDIYWGPYFRLDWREGFQLVGDLKASRASRDLLLTKNPNMLIVTHIFMRGGSITNFFPENFPYWIRDENGNPIVGGPNSFLLDFTHPGMQDIIVQQAIALSRCGLFDGILIDWWREDVNVLRDHRSFEAEQQARDIIIQAVRAAVGPDFLIIVNSNRSKIPRTGPGNINGIFMETHRDHDDGYTHESLMRIESTLLWAEENLRAPQLNCLENTSVKYGAPDSPENQQWMRVFTTLTLTHSDGYVLSVFGDLHAHIWYDFWGADLGRPIGPKGQPYQNHEGVFIREFTNGWAVYNRSSKPQEITLPSPATGVESQHTGATHQLPDLDGEIYLKSPVSPYDLNKDGMVNIFDLIIVANRFGAPTGDVNGDGTTDIFDLVLVSQNF